MKALIALIALLTTKTAHAVLVTATVLPHKLTLWERLWALLFN
jgi:hypothetical protein